MSKKSKDNWVRIIEVSEPVLHKKGYTLYKVTSKVFPKNSVEAVTEVTVWKRYNDFKKLHKALSTLHQSLYLKDTFPSFAKTRIFGRFEPDVIEERRQSALKLLQFAANCSPLFTSQVFVKFFEDGYFVENKSNSIREEKKLDDVLQPQTLPILPTRLESKLLESTEENRAIQNTSLQEPIAPLGGIWEHHQVPDNISLGSHCTDDDDRTTFTDDESTVSRQSLNLADFDPLLQSKNDSSRKNTTDQEDLCNSWLLSALQSCSSMEGDRDLENILEFPTPFSDFEIPEDYVMPSKKSPVTELVEDTKENRFTFDFPTPVAEEALETSDFDPLIEKYSNPPDEGDSYMYDRFAMTPNSDKQALSRRPSFVVLASKYVSSAKEAEAAGQYKEAFDLYKKAIDVLLQGCKKDKSSELQDSVKKKVLLYLMRAEELYENKLPKSDINKKIKTVASNFPVSSVKLNANLKGSVQDLNKYKVLGVLDKVLLVLDISSNCTFIVKTLYKSPNPQVLSASQTDIQNVPFVVKLHQVYETNYALFLILEHATGGRLWDYISSFLQRSPLSPCNDGMCLYIESKTKPDLCNVYSGKKVADVNSLESKNLKNSADSDLTASENCPSSYVALFKTYADTVEREDNVSLAKYTKVHHLNLNDGTRETVHDDIHIDVSKKLSQLQPPKTARNRLSSSTGSLETTYSQKPCNLDALHAMDNDSEKPSSKTHLPESCVVMWAAEIVLAFEALHNLGIIWMDFHPQNILLGEEGHILLTYQNKWNNIDFFVNKRAKENLFCAPEVGSIFPVTADCDWWSVGAILFELLTGQSLKSCHPTGITQHTIINFPTDITSDAKNFIVKLLQYNSAERLGSGIYGVEEIKSHPFFRNIDWKSLLR